MDFDDDAPPDLVEVTGGEDEEEEKEVPFKVPITIVTGMRPTGSIVPQGSSARLTVLKGTSGLAKQRC